MAIDSAKALPFGLRDVGLKLLSADGLTPGTKVDLPIVQTFSFSEEEDFTELRGDDAYQATHGSGPKGSWDLEAGGISLDAYAIIAGGTVTVSGVTPAVKRSYSKLITDARPYFKAEGQAINDNGGDFHGLYYRAKATGTIEGQLADGEFFMTKASGVGYGSLEGASLGKVYDFVHNEAALALT